MNRCAFIHRLWLLGHRRTTSRFATGLGAPRQVQERLLLETLRRNQHTAYGQRYDFSSIDTLEAYQQRVPLCDYEALEDDIRRIRCGEQGVLTAEPVTRLIPTSGTTSAAKLIPYTSGLQRQFNEAIGPWVTDLFRTYPELMNGPSYWSISPAINLPGASDSKVPVGFDDDTAYLGRIGRRLVGTTLAVPNTVRHLQGFDEFRYATLWWLLRARELRLVSVWHPSFWSLLVDALPRWWDALIDDLSHGRCSLPSGDTMAVERLRPIRDLNHVSAHDWRSIWPRLTVISAWGDAAAEQPFAALQGAWPGVEFQPKGILSTEAFVSFPWRGQYPAAVTSHVIELLEEDGACIGIDAAEVGGQYEAVVTTAGGLYRYRTGDCVEVTGRVEQTPTLRLLGRAGQTHDICGEKLHEQHVKAALDATFRKVNVRPEFVMLATAEPQPPTHYELFVAADGAWQVSTLSEIQNELERQLCENPHYAYARRLGQLQVLTVHRVGTGAHQRFLERMQENGQAAGGIKPALISKQCGWHDYFNANVSCPA